MACETAPVKTFGVVARPKAPHGYRGRWVNIYRISGRDHIGGSYRTRAKADSIAKPYRHSCVYIWIEIERRS